MAVQHKRVQHYHEPGDVHELTFSCYQRWPLLENDAHRCILAECVTLACDKQGYFLSAFVFMPEHVHLLVYPTKADSKISLLLAAIKRPTSVAIKQILIDNHDNLLQKLTVRERPGKLTFRFWQEGPGYDRNLQSESSVMAAVDYIHLNPVRRGLCDRATEWYWSSACFYASPIRRQEPNLPRIVSLPPQLFD